MHLYKEATEWLDKLASEKKFFHTKAKPNLEVTLKVLEALGNPDKDFQWRVIVGGTAGKGSVCRYTEQTLLSQGKSVALISSPHLQVITERIRLNGRLIDSEVFGGNVLEIKAITQKLQVHPTYYEAIVLTGILAAKKAGVEICICEVGIGGEMDAVNALKGKRIAALTFIGHDHLEMFDDSIEKLAEAKAGIFTKDSKLNISFEQKYRSILEKKSSSKILFLKGIKQKMNKKIARNICEQILDSNSFEMITPHMPCRWEKISTHLVIDGAHSAPRFEYILPKIKKLKSPRCAILGLGKNHDPEIFNIILDQFDEVIWSAVPNLRLTWPAKMLYKQFKVGSAIADPKEALEAAQSWQKAHNGIIFVNGLFLGGAVRNRFYTPEAILDQCTEFPIPNP